MAASQHTYLLLLRGINVGGKNVIKMADLKSCLEAHGLTDVQTYIQSGNVLFRSSKTKATLVKEIETVLSKEFNYEATVVIVTEAELRAVVEKAPKDFGAKPDTYHSDVVFLMPPLNAAEAKPQFKLREEVDQVWAGNGVIYFSRLSAERTKSKLSKITELPIYKQLTIRSWSTTTKLLGKLDELTE